MKKTLAFILILCLYPQISYPEDVRLIIPETSIAAAVKTLLDARAASFSSLTPAYGVENYNVRLMYNQTYPVTFQYLSGNRFRLTCGFVARANKRFDLKAFSLSFDINGQGPITIEGDLQYEVGIARITLIGRATAVVSISGAPGFLIDIIGANQFTVLLPEFRLGTYTLMLPNVSTTYFTSSTPSLAISGSNLTLGLQSKIVVLKVDQLRQSGERLEGSQVGVWEGLSFVGYPVPRIFNFPRGSTQVLRGEQGLAQSPPEKYNRWNDLSNVQNHQPFLMDGSLTRLNSNFKQTDPTITIKTDLIDLPGTTGGNIQFKDPWYIDYPDPSYGSNLRNQGMSAPFKTRSSPFYPDLNTLYDGSLTYKGVFLNQVPDQNDSTKPYYSVKADAVQYIHLPHTGRVYPFYFQGWSASPDGSAEFQNANALETPVVFKNPGAVVSANYKGTQLSNNKNAFSKNSQRKFVRSNYNRMLHVVYESMGKIWYETSTDNGITWQIRNGGKSLSNTEAKNPSIFIINDFHTHSVVAIVFQERNGDFYNIKALTYSTYSDSIMDVSLIKTVLKPYSENANPVIAFGHNIIVVWQEGYGNYWEPQGLYYVYGEIGLGYKFRWTDTTYLHYPFTDTNTENVNPTISRVDDVPINIFHLAWEARNRARGTSDIMFCKITSYNNVTIINDVMNISYGNGFRYNHSPSIISVKDNDRKEFAIVCWIGEREDWPNSINPQMQKQVILTSTSRPGIFKVFGENVSSVSINKSSTRWTVGWSRSNDLPLQYTDSRGVSIYQLDVYGEYIQIGNGILPEQMYALAFNTRALPYTINTKQIYPQYIPTEVISTTKLREGVVSKDGVQIYYSIGDIKVGNEKIDFIEMPDTIKINTLQDANYYLMSEPFELDDNSEFYYTIKFGISDSNAVKQALSENEFINFSVELIDAITNELIGVLNEVTYDQHNVAQYNEVSYQVNTSGIGNRVVRLRLVITNNIDPHYAISDKYFDESISLAKRQIKQINYKGKLEIKDYALYQNYPNPFNHVTKIRFSIKETNPVKIKLYDIVGREVAVIMNEVKDAGEYEIELDAGKLGISSGVYFYQMKAGDYTSIKKMVYLK